MDKASEQLRDSTVPYGASVLIPSSSMVRNLRRHGTRLASDLRMWACVLHCRMGQRGRARIQGPKSWALLAYITVGRERSITVDCCSDTCMSYAHHHHNNNNTSAQTRSTRQTARYLGRSLSRTGKPFLCRPTGFRDVFAMRCDATRSESGREKDEQRGHMPVIWMTVV